MWITYAKNRDFVRILRLIQEAGRTRKNAKQELAIDLYRGEGKIHFVYVGVQQAYVGLNN
jgi:hypothetical protein